MQGIPVTDPQTIAQSSAAASAAQSTSPAAARLLTVRAILLGERIDTTGLERSDAISTVPFAFRVGDRGMVALFRYGAAVIAGLSPVEEDDILRMIQPRELGSTTGRDKVCPYV